MANNLFIQAVYPDCTIHTVVEGSKDGGVQLTPIARISEMTVCLILIVCCKSCPFLCFCFSNVLSLGRRLIASAIVMLERGMYLLQVTHRSLLP
jgi:hypothetical protein